MQDESVLVEVWVPAAYLKKDMFLPMDMPIYLVFGLLDKIFQNLGYETFKIQSQTRLYRLTPFEEIEMHATLREYHVMNAETFVLI